MVKSERDPRRPGGRPGLAAIVADQFEVSADPVINRAEAARRIRAKIAADGVPCERLDISDVPVRRGALFDMEGARVPFPDGDIYESCYVGLIDPTVDAQWAHPAHWAFVPAEPRGEVVLRSTNFPPHALGAVRLRPEPHS